MHAARARLPPRRPQRDGSPAGRCSPAAHASTWWDAEARPSTWCIVWVRMPSRIASWPPNVATHGRRRWSRCQLVQRVPRARLVGSAVCATCMHCRLQRSRTFQVDNDQSLVASRRPPPWRPAPPAQRGRRPHARCAPRAMRAHACASRSGTRHVTTRDARCVMHPSPQPALLPALGRRVNDVRTPPTRRRRRRRDTGPWTCAR